MGDDVSRWEWTAGRTAFNERETGASREMKGTHMSAASTGKEEAITRSWNGLDIPVPGTWEFDPAHTSIIVVGRHSMIVKVRGRFNEFSGRIHVAESPADSW